MCEGCETYARAIIDAAHRYRAGHLDWYEAIEHAAAEGETEALAGLAMSGAVVLAVVLDRWTAALRSAALAPWLDADACTVQMLDRAAAQLRVSAHVGEHADGSQ